jgi:hypothetical protein
MIWIAIGLVIRKPDQCPHPPPRNITMMTQNPIVHDIIAPIIPQKIPIKIFFIIKT